MILFDTPCIVEGPEVQTPSGSEVVRGYTEINQTSASEQIGVEKLTKLTEGNAWMLETASTIAKNAKAADG